MDQNWRPTKQHGNKSFKKGSRSGELSSSTAPEDLAEYILKVLACEPDSLQFERTSSNPGRSRIAVTCDPTITGRLIGKEGKTISALRSFIRSMAVRYGKRVDIDIA
jgi:predicted RNA-binding protein YlqC (UPF0109 family)